MASIKIEEPRVKVTEKIREYPVQLNIDGTSNVGGVIVAPCGPRLSYVAGPKDFLEKYTVDGEIPRNADKTLVNAYYLSFSAGLVIARSMNTTAVNGLFFTTEKKKESKLLINANNESQWGLLFDNVYYWCNNDDTDWNNFIEVLKQITNDEGNPVYNASTIEKIKTAGEEANVSCSDFSDLADKLASALSKSQGSNYDAVYSDKVGGIIFSPDIETIYQIDDSVKSTLVGLQLNIITSDSESTALVSHPINYKDGQALTESEVLKFTFPNGIDGNWAFAYGTMAYYHGAIDKSKYDDYSLKSVSSLGDIADSINGIQGMSAEVTKENAEITVYFSQGNRLYIASEDTGLNYNVVVQQANDATSIDMSKMMFAIYPDDAQDSNVYKMTVSPNTGETFDITLFDGETYNTYTVSLVPDAVDSANSNCFIENLNALGIGFTIVTNPDIEEEVLWEEVPKLTQVFSFGDSGLSLSGSKRVTCLINALYALEDQELYDIEYLAPLGIVDLQFIKNYILVGKNNDWFTPVDIPYQKTNANSIKGYFLNVDMHSNVMGMGPFDKNTGLTTWMNYIACSTLYYTKVMNNKAAYSEFAPVFDQTNGILDFTNPVYMLGKEDRVKLLNFKAPVNFLVYNQRLSVYYLNDNRTHQYENNIVSEEQNRRQVNKIKKDCKRLMQRFKGRLNTTTTRSDVVSLLTYYFQTQVMNQNYKPNEYQIICDESNNTTEIITANKLAVTVRVRLENAIKFIDVLVDVFPLGVDFNS